MSEEKLGFVKLKKAERTKGHKRGFANIELDSHALAYIIEGLQCRIGKFETNIREHGPLNAGDQISYDYTKELRDAIEDVRNTTLTE